MTSPEPGTAPIRSRAEHMQWCKDRALQYVDQGDIPNAIASMTSDLSKHPETENHGAIKLMVMMTMAGQLSSPGEVRKFIEGFN